MAIERLSQASILTFNKYSSMMAGGAAGDYELISSQILTGTAASITFSNIPTWYKHLQVRMTARSTGTNQADSIICRFNSDSGTNYSVHVLYGSGGSIGSFNITGRDSLILGNATTSFGAANIFGASIADILDYANTNKYKTTRAFTGYVNANPTQSELDFTSGLWLSTAAISSMTMSPYAGVFVIGSRFSLYGIKG